MFIWKNNRTLSSHEISNYQSRKKFAIHSFFKDKNIEKIRNTCPQNEIDITVLFSFNFTRVCHALFDPLMPYKHRHFSTFAFLPQRAPLPSPSSHQEWSGSRRGEGVQVFETVRLSALRNVPVDELWRTAPSRDTLRSTLPILPLASHRMLKLASEE